MKIVAVCACTMGVAHTYIAQDKLVAAAEAEGHEIKCETQGSVGIENRIEKEDVENADVVIIASDININEAERFAGKPIVKVPVTVAIKQPKQLLKKIEDKLKGEANE